MSTFAPPISIPFGAIGGPRLVAGSEGDVVDQAKHLQVHRGPVAMRQGDLERLCASVNLAGRGGGDFPVAQKLNSLRPGHRVVVVNASESEPASHKDRLLLSLFPHLVLDGAGTVAAAVGASQVRLVVHDPRLVPGLELAMGVRLDGALFRVDVLPGGFVAGEARAVIRWLNGGPALPPGRRILPTHTGVGGAPTFLSNAETFAQIAILAELGPVGFANTGTPGEPGTTLLSVGGAVARPGVFEVPLGVDLQSVLDVAVARLASAVVVGGYHGSWVPPIGQLALSRAGLAAQGATLGAGVVLVLDEHTCGLGELARVASWLAAESAGQCGPCRFGLPAIANDLAATMTGQPTGKSALGRHSDVVLGRGACAHPDGAVRFIKSGLALLRHEVDAHRRGGCGRPVRGQFPISRSVRR
jgi:NADH:ubiquinone oxidoreductase subunit F (NADH-binding)